MKQENNSAPRLQWTVYKALLLSTACLAIGIALGWVLQPAASSHSAATHPAAAPQTDVQNDAQNTTSAQPDPNAQLKAAADSQAAPLIAKLKADPKNTELIISIGNLYYDAKQYSPAINYYGQALKINPADASVRTDLATAYWYTGDPDTALTEFDKALSYVPNNPNTLFNRGMVKWQGKMDAQGALADWKKLLATNPNYQDKDQVQKMIDEVQKHQTGQTGTGKK
jgi:tetratricopeptide (TPR) repeat protein